MLQQFNFELYGLQAIEKNRLLVVIRNRLTKSIKNLYFDNTNNDFNLLEYCQQFRIDTTDYLKSIEDAETVTETSNDFISNYVSSTEKYDAIPQWQYNKNNLTEFTYRLLVFKNYILNSCKYKIDFDNMYKITKRMYFEGLYRQYLNLKKRYFDNSYYKLSCLKRLNKRMYQFILANI